MKHDGENSSGTLSHPTPPKRIPKEKSLEKDLRTQPDNVKDVKCSVKESRVSTTPVTNRSVITSVSKWKNDSSGVSSSSCGSKHHVENFKVETLAKPAKVDFVPVISCAEQKQLFTPQLPSGTKTAATDDKADKRRQAESVTGSVNTSVAEKQVRSSHVPGSDDVLKKTASVPKTVKKKRTNVEGIKLPCKRKHQSGKNSGTKKRISDVVESLRKEKERPVSVLRNVDLNNGSSVVRSTIICKVESSHGKNSVISPSPVPAVESPCSQISAVSSSALGGKPSHKNTATLSSDALATESSFGMNIANTSSSAAVAESAHNNRIVKTLPTSLASQEGEVSSASLMTNHMVESSLTQKYSAKVCERACRKKLLLKLERLTHRHIKRDFLKKHQISMRSGIVLRRQLRNWDIKRYLTLYGKKPPLLPSESFSLPSPEPSDEKETRYPKIENDDVKSVALQDMLQEAHTGVESGFGPPEPDIFFPSTSTSVQPQKRKARKVPLPRLRFMGEHSEALSNKGSSQAARVVCDRSSDQTSPGIISCNKQQLLVLKNERLSLGQVNFLSLIGSGLAKKASDNSDLDSIPGSQIMMDPGFFGLKGTSHPPPSWSLVLDAQGTKIESSTNMAPTPSQGHTPREISGIQGPPHHSKVLQPGQVHSATLPSSPTYNSTSLPLGQVYATAFMTPGQQIQSGQGQYHVVTPIPGGRDGNAQGHAASVIHQRRIFAPIVIPPSHQPSSAGLPSAATAAAAVQAPNSPMGTRILTVDHAGRVRDTLNQSIPSAYSRYSASASRPDSWNNQRPSARASPPPPLTFMGVGAVNTSMRDVIPSTKAPRGMPPPLSFMGSSSETSTRPLIHITSSQSSPRPSNAGVWTRALDLSQQSSASRTYGVINHTRHVIPEKLPLNMPYPAHGNGLEQRPSGLPYVTQVHVLDHHPPSISNAMQTNVIPHQQPFKVSHTNRAQVIHDHRQPGLPYNVQGKLLNHHKSNTPQETHEQVMGNQQQLNLPHSVLHQNDVNQRPSSHRTKISDLQY
ncbi:uncharacterized protein [Panulirus ornatus]|uniref:uncharacterized protein n=1 Tax=Panulirus ornatus TaxID=150431 RepID=UPI003A89FABC